MGTDLGTDKGIAGRTIYLALPSELAYNAPHLNQVIPWRPQGGACGSEPTALGEVPSALVAMAFLVERTVGLAL